MVHRDNKRKKRRINRIDFLDPSVIEDSDITAEKDKARKLKGSSWWRRKKSSGKCNYCGNSFPPNELTMDHLIPLSRGGKSEKYNIVPACKECNSKKKYLLPAEWEEHLEKIKNRQV